MQAKKKLGKKAFWGLVDFVAVFTLWWLLLFGARFLLDLSGNGELFKDDGGQFILFTLAGVAARLITTFAIRFIKRCARERHWGGRIPNEWFKDGAEH